MRLPSHQLCSNIRTMSSADMMKTPVFNKVSTWCRSYISTCCAMTIAQMLTHAKSYLMFCNKVGEIPLMKEHMCQMSAMNYSKFEHSFGRFFPRCPVPPPRSKQHEKAAESLLNPIFRPPGPHWSLCEHELRPAMANML